ncbi:hypothetical protein [Actinocorallia libanotica]|uniref:hypothetical protein n=1 Tax=Actinocorallia libanotica TaxID=46162 RepID=UPI0031E04A05
MSRLPRPVRELLRLERGEKVLAHASTRGGSVVAATGHALHVPDGRGGFTRVPWEKVLRASWQGDRLHVQGDDTDYQVRLVAPGSVPEVVQERVTSTVVVSRHFDLEPGTVDGGGVRIVGRRPTHDRPSPSREELLWAMVFDEGVDSDDPKVRAKAEQLLQAVRRQVGL